MAIKCDYRKVPNSLFFGSWIPLLMVCHPRLEAPNKIQTRSRSIEGGYSGLCWSIASVQVDGICYIFTMFTRLLVYDDKKYANTEMDSP